MDYLFEMIVKLTPVFEKLGTIMVYVKDINGKFVYMNSSFLKFFGKTTADFLYKKTLDSSLGKNRQIELLLDEEVALINKKSLMIEKTLRMPNAENQENFLRVIKTPIYDLKEENIIGILSVVVDVSSDRSFLFSGVQILFRRLSKSEKQYFFFRSEGRSRAEIAKDMDTTIETVDSHRYRIMKKLKVNDDEMILLERIYRIFINDSI